MLDCPSSRYRPYLRSSPLVIAGGIRRNSGGYQVGWEAVTANWNYWQPVDNSITYVYVRLQRSAALNSYRMGWRFKLADVWAYVSTLATTDLATPH